MRPSSSAFLAMLLVTACAPPESSAVGRVTWAGTASGEDIDVTLIGPVTRATRTDVEGTWILRQLPPGEYAVVAEAADTLERRVTTTLQVVAQYRAEAEPLTLTRVGKISGAVTLPGASSNEGASVLVVGGAGAAQTAADGRFTLDAIPTGKRDLWVYATGFEPAQLTGIEVHRGATTAVPPLSLAPLEAGNAPLVGTLRGRAWLPGTDDHSGIRVEVAGTSLHTLTAADGAFTLADVPNGIVAMSFRKGDAAAQLSRVLVVSGGNGFIVDQGLYDLGRLPVPLRRGRRLLDKTAGMLAVAPGGQWAVVQSGTPSRLWLFGPDGQLKKISADESASFGSYGFGPGAPPSAYWFTAYDPKLSEYTLNQTVLATGATTAFARLANLYDFRFAAGSAGAAWIQERTLHLRSSPSVPETKLFEGKAAGVVALSGETMLVAAAGALHTVQLDGTIVQTVPIALGADWLVASADRRWVTVGTGGLSGAPVGAQAMLVDRTTQALAQLACPYPQFSPDSDALLCNTLLHRLAPDGTVTAQPVGAHSNPAPWLGGGRVVLAYPPALRILAPNQPEVVVTGLSWDSVSVFPTTDGKRIRLLANVDPLTGLGQALEVRLADGAVTVLADGAASRPFVANDRGVLIGRPRTVGTDLDLFFIPDSGPEVPLGRTAKALGANPSMSTGGTFFGVRRFIGGRGYESVVLDTRGAVDPVLPIALSYGTDRWLDDKRLLQSMGSGVPFTEAGGLFLVELP